MKIKLLSLISVLVVGNVFLAIAQSPTPAPSPSERIKSSGADAKRPGEKMRQRFLENLPPEMRERFENARRKALDDPKIQELRQKSEQTTREFMEAMRKKMQEIDPGLAEYVKENALKPDGQRREKRGGQDGDGMAKLTDDERAKLMAARAQAKDDPSVRETRKKMETASTPEERRTAGEEFRKAMHDAMVKTDASLEDILKKLGPPPENPPPPPQDQMQMDGKN